MRLHNVRRLGPLGLSAPTTVDVPAVDDAERDASGLILSPGWMDLHAHLRDPGYPQKETLESGAASAAFGGFTHVLAMANTDPVTDRPDRLEAVAARAASLPIRVSFVGAMTMGLEGRRLTDARGLRAAGARALSDDGRHRMDAASLRRALDAARLAGLPVLLHAQKEELGSGPDAEAAAVEEALEIFAQVPGARLHLQHISTLRAVELIRAAKSAGLSVTSEVTPHHLALTEQDLARLGAQGRVNPPLRSNPDRQSVLTALLDGVIDVIATDHAPHEPAAKAAGANGFHGFETALGVLLTLGIDYAVLYRACVERPREIIGITEDLPTSWMGFAWPDWILIDPDLDWTVDPSGFRSRGKNSAFAGRRLHGRVVMTVCRGQLLFERMAQRV